MNLRKFQGLLNSARVSRESFAKGLSTTEDERREHLAAMKAVVNDPAAEKIHGWIHANLIILDSKAQAILGLYSIALAALTVYYSTLGNNAPAFIVGVVVAGFVVIAWSIIPLARISYVYWSSTDEFTSPDRLLMDLLRLRDQRTILVRRSVLKGVLTMTIFTILIVWDLIHRLM